VTLALRYAAMSHVGLLRTGNEDSVYAGPRLLAVADGMGGHAAGEVASAVAIASVAVLDEDAPGADLLAALREAAVNANVHLRDLVALDAALDGMGTTLTSLLFTGNRLGLLHIGDSRCYLLRDGVLKQITHDDTLVQSLVDEGRISLEEAGEHPQRNMILRALDGREDVEFDLSVREARVGDRYLLCSDGLTGPVGHETLQEALSQPDPQGAAERLVELALRGGGPDNITVIVADVVDGESTGVPVVAGAAAESPQPLPGHLTSGAAGRAAAERAVATAPPEPAPSSVALPPRRRQLRRAALLSLVVLLLLAAGTGAGWAYLQSQWYVGTDGERVSVYRGVAGSLAGVDLSSVTERTDLQTDALTELDREDVDRGIRADSPNDARRIVEVLHGRVVCAAVPATPALPPAVVGPEPSPTPSPGGAPPASASDCPGAAPTPGQDPSPAAATSPEPTAAPAGEPSTAGPTTAPTTGAASPAPFATAPPPSLPTLVPAR